MESKQDVPLVEEQNQQLIDSQMNGSESNVFASNDTGNTDGNAQDILSVEGQNQQTVESQMNGTESNIPASNDTGNADDKTLFVGGMHFQTGYEDLRQHFEQYGDIKEIKINMDPITGRSRGFGFIVFKSAGALSKIEAAGAHVINGKKVDAQKAKSRKGKIFVGGLSADLTDDDIKSHFAQFGTIVEVQMLFDKMKNRRKGFCFITFESDKVVKDLLQTPKQKIKWKEVDIRKAPLQSEQTSSSTMKCCGHIGNMRGGKENYGGPGFNRSYGPQRFSYNSIRGVDNARCGHAMRGRHTFDGRGNGRPYRPYQLYQPY
nr:RNA-binding protein squid-like [Leptinotarsa decemlineata]